MTRLSVSVLLTLLVIATCARITVAQNTFPTPSGNVGIGTTSPERLLTVFASSGSPTIQVTTETGAGTGLTLQSDATNRYVWSYGGVPLLFGTNGAERLRITSDGNVGIGTTTPVNKLSVYGTSGNASTSAHNGLFTLWNSNGVQLSVGASVNSPYGVFFQTKDNNNAGPYHYPILLNPVDGNVGIGTTNPSASKLQIVGDSGFTTEKTVGGYFTSLGFSSNNPYLTYYSNTGLTLGYGQTTGGAPSVDTMTLTNSGNVGIGTTSPVAKLDISDGTTHAYLAPRSVTSGNFNQGTDIGSWGHTLNLSGGIVDGNTSSGVNINFFNGSVWQRALQIKNNATGNLLLMPDQGKVGIGTPTPGYTLDVNGAINATSLNINGSPVTTSQWSSGSGNVNYTSGNVGIGTTSPSASKLQIVGDSGFTTEKTVGGYFTSLGFSSNNPYLTYYSNTGLTLGYGQTTGGAPSVNTMTLTNSGNVGIGTTSPPAQLGINQDTDVQATLRLSNNGISGRQINIKSAAAGLSGSIVQSNTGADFEIGNLSGALSFTTNNANRLYVKNDGKVGINNNNPTAELDVNGDIKASGVIHAKYQDVAEWVPSSEQLAAGTVVVLDSTKSNQVISSTVSYDTRVAGVISEQPGLALGEKADNKVLVATTGRVKVKVDASKGPINIGDLLVTSDVPGVAMKSEPVEFAGRKMHMPGTLIGKALEPLEKGKGDILVLLSLQ